MSNIEIGVLGTERSNSIKVNISEWKGKTYVDVRNWFKNKSGDWCPTKKGLFVSEDNISSLITMLEQAEQKLKAPTPKPKQEVSA